MSTAAQNPGLPLDRSATDERINTLTHAFGWVLSVIGAAVLLARVFAHGDSWQRTGCGLYALSLVAVYTCSTISHGAWRADWKHLFRRLDQGFIYFLIVGTYTPFALNYLRTAPWLAFLALLWFLALAGFISKVLLGHLVESVSIWMYLILGWVHVIAGIRLVGLLPPTALWWMLFGGLCYTFGTVFLFLDRRFPQFHAVWHMCVVSGSAFHFFAIWWFVAQA